MLNETQINEIKNQLNLAIRSDKMSREHVVKAFELLADIQQTTAAAPVAAPVAARFGEPVSLPVVAPVKKPAVNSKGAALLAALRRRAYPVLIRTLANETGISSSSIHSTISYLKAQGYKIKGVQSASKGNRMQYQLMKKGG